MESVDKFVLVPSVKYENLTRKRKAMGDEETMHPPGRKQMNKTMDDLKGFLKRRGKGLLEWNDEGEIVYKGTAVAGSSIEDLLKDSSKKYKDFDPIGDREFYRALAAMDVPKRLIGNPDRWEDVLYYRNSKPLYMPPPPGIPDGVSKPKRVTKTKWLKVK